MAHERSTEYTHHQNPNQKRYDWAYYNALLPQIKGKVLDIGAGAGMFAKEYAKKEEVTEIVAEDQQFRLTDEPTKDISKDNTERGSKQ